MNTFLRWLVLSCFALLLLAAHLPQPAAAQTGGHVYYVTANRGLTIPAAGMVRRAVREAEAAGATALVIELQGGGSISAAWPLARDLANAGVPVVTYITPRGGQSGPVGTLLIAASHVAAMAPASSIGFAAPLVDVPAGFTATTQQLVVDDAARQVAEWSRARGRDAAWFEQAVRQGAIVEAERAQSLQPPLIEIVAASPDELLTTLQGRQVTLADGTQRTLDTLGTPVRTVAPSVWEGLGQLLALPTLAFILFVLGGLAVYLELATPGLGVPGVTGALLIVAAMIGFVLGEVRPLAVLMLAAGLVIVGLDHVTPSTGGLTIAGLVLLVLGALYLVDPARSPGLEVSYAAIGGVALMLGVGAVGLIALAVRTRTRRPVTGQEGLVGRLAEVRQTVAPEGMVFVNGALWSAWSDEGPFEVGELVEVAGMEGLRLYVRRVSHE
jgi:membrane-bound serine protease (ClpP class)